MQNRSLSIKKEVKQNGIGIVRVSTQLAREQRVHSEKYHLYHLQLQEISTLVEVQNLFSFQSKRSKLKWDWRNSYCY